MTEDLYQLFTEIGLGWEFSTATPPPQPKTFIIYGVNPNFVGFLKINKKNLSENKIKFRGFSLKLILSDLIAVSGKTLPLLKQLIMFSTQ